MNTFTDGQEIKNISPYIHNFVPGNFVLGDSLLIVFTVVSSEEFIISGKAHGGLLSWCRFQVKACLTVTLCRQQYWAYDKGDSSGWPSYS